MTDWEMNLMLAGHMLGTRVDPDEVIRRLGIAEDTRLARAVREFAAKRAEAGARRRAEQGTVA